jgi:hypothetical protein
MRVKIWLQVEVPADMFDAVHHIETEVMVVEIDGVVPAELRWRAAVVAEVAVERIDPGCGP